MDGSANGSGRRRVVPPSSACFMYVPAEVRVCQSSMATSRRSPRHGVAHDQSCPARRATPGVSGQLRIHRCSDSPRHAFSVVSRHEMFKGSPKAMTFIESLPLACSGQEASGQDRKSATGCAWENSDTRRGDGGPLKGNLLALKCHLVGWRPQNGHKRGCGQCPHPLLRIRLYRRRTGSDWGC